METTSGPASSASSRPFCDPDPDRGFAEELVDPPRGDVRVPGRERLTRARDVRHGRGVDDRGRRRLAQVVAQVAQIVALTTLCGLAGMWCATRSATMMPSASSAATLLGLLVSSRTSSIPSERRIAAAWA